MQRIYRPLYGYVWLDGGESFLSGVFSAESLADELKDVKQPCWIVSCDNTEIGIVKLSLDVTPSGAADTDFIKLHRIYLDTNFHRKGIGQALMQFIDDLSRRLGKKVLWLETMVCAPKVIGFYERNGFSYVNGITLPYPNAHEHLRPMQVMAKPLN